MDATELKKYIKENELHKDVLEYSGCHSISDGAKEIRAGLPDGRNKTAVALSKDSLRVTIRNSEGETYGDIYTLVMKLKGFSFGKCIKELHQLFGLEYSYSGKTKVTKAKKDPLQIFKRVAKKRCYVNQDLDVYDSHICSEYTNMPHIDWVREGIIPKAFNRFNIGYSYDKKRIVIPERWWCGSDDDYVGIIGRTTVKNFELFDIPKYFPLVAFPKGRNIYGLNENYEAIQKAGYVVVFESQKSVLKRYSRLDETGVSIGGSTVSDEQAKILIGLNVDIILCFDNGLSRNHIRSQCEKFYGMRNVSYTFDTWGVLKEKESPADRESKVFNHFIKYRIKYDRKERKELVHWQESLKKN